MLKDRRNNRGRVSYNFLCHVLIKVNKKKKKKEIQEVYGRVLVFLRWHHHNIVVFPLVIPVDILSFLEGFFLFPFVISSYVYLISYSIYIIIISWIKCFSKLEIISSLSLISFIGKLNIIVNNNYINIVYTCSGI